MRLDKKTLGCWIGDGTSFVAVDPETGGVVAHIAVEFWPKGGSPRGFELRSVVVKEGYQGKGVNRQMTYAVVDEIFSTNPDAVVIEVKKAEDGLRLMKVLGFVEWTLEEASNEIGLVLRAPEWGLRKIYKLTRESYDLGSKKG